MAEKPKSRKPATPFEKFVAAIASVPKEKVDAISAAGERADEPGDSPKRSQQRRKKQSLP